MMMIFLKGYLKCSSIVKLLFNQVMVIEKSSIFLKKKNPQQPPPMPNLSEVGVAGTQSLPPLTQAYHNAE